MVHFLGPSGKPLMNPLGTWDMGDALCVSSSLPVVHGTCGLLL